jgi:hypothetical protein
MKIINHLLEISVLLNVQKTLKSLYLISQSKVYILRKTCQVLYLSTQDK